MRETKSLKHKWRAIAIIMLLVALVGGMAVPAMAQVVVVRPPRTIEAVDVEVSELGAATYDDVQDYINFFGDRTLLSGGAITAHGDADGSVAVAACTAWCKASDSDTAVGNFFDYAGKAKQTLTDVSVNLIYLDYNAGTPQIVVATAPATYGFQQDHILVGVVFRQGNAVHIFQSSNIGVQGINRAFMHAVEHDGAHRGSGLVTSDGGTLSLSITTGIIYAGLNRQTTTVDGSTWSYWYTDDSGATWTEDTGISALVQSYNDITSGKVSLGSNKFGVHWVYVDYEGSHVHIVYGQGNYAAPQAEEATVPSVLPPIVTGYGVLIAKIINQEGTNDLTITYPWTTVFTSSLATDHGSLGGLGDDDHPQYIKDAEFTQDSGILVGTGAGAFAEETGATLRTSIGLGIGDSPQFTALELGHASDTTITRESAGSVLVEGTSLVRGPGPVPGSATDNAIVRWDGTIGDAVQDYLSNAPTISDTGDMNIDGDLDVENIVVFGTVDGIDVSALDSAVVKIADLENPPTEDESAKAPTSEWAFDHEADIEAHYDMSGSTFPTSPVDGMMFCHELEGRKILYCYDLDNTTWVSVESIGTMTLYVDKTDGSDSLEDHGTGVDGDAFATVQFATDCIPGLAGGNVLIYVNDESYTETVTILGKQPTGNYVIQIIGTLVAEETASSATVAAGGSGTQGTVTKAGAFTGDTYANLLAYFVTDGSYRIIDSHTDNVLTLVGSAPSSTAQDVIVYDWGTAIKRFDVKSLMQVIFRGVSLTGAGTWTCLNVGSERFAKATLQYSELLYRPYVNQGGIVLDYSVVHAAQRHAFDIAYGGAGTIGYSKICLTHDDASCEIYNGGSMVFRHGSICEGYVDGADEADAGLEVFNNGVVLISNVSAGWVRIRNCDKGIYAYAGGMVTGTANTQYSGNGNDETATAASFGYID